MQTGATAAADAADTLDGSRTNGSRTNGNRSQRRLRVVVVGCRKSLRVAVETRLRQAFTVDPVRRGDDLIGSLEGAGAVVVIDIARAWNLPTRYSATLRAIASVLIKHKPDVVVCLTYGPGSPLHRRLYLSRCDRAEEELRNTGVPVVSLRPRLIVGTPSSRGPNDGALFSGWLKYGRQAPVALPRDGSQPVTPVCIGDVAELVARTIAAPPGDGGAIEEVAGPEQMTLDDLVERLNGPQTRHVHVPAALLNLVSPRKRFLPPRTTHPAAARARLHGYRLNRVAEAWTTEVVRVRSRSRRGPIAFTTWYRLGAPMFLTALYTALVGCFALTIGFHDVFAVTELGQRLASVLLVGTGALLGAAAIVLLFSRSRVRYAVGFVAACVAAALGAMLFGSGVSSGDPSRVAIWIAVSVCGVLAALALRNRAGPELSTVLRTGRLKFLTSIVSVGAIIGFGQWWYSTQYVPPSALPTLTVTARMTPSGTTGERDRYFVVNGEITMTNQGDHPVNVVASQYEVIAAQVVQRRPAQASVIGALAAQLADGDAPRTSLSVAAHERMIEIGVPVPSESYLAPHDTRTSTFTFYVPASYDTVRLHAIAITSRRKLVFDRKIRSEPGGVRDLDAVAIDSPGTFQAARAIDESSWLRRLTRSDRVLVVRRTTSPQGDTAGGCYFSPWLDASVERRSQYRKNPTAPACGKINTRFERYYGLVSSDAAGDLDLRAKPATAASTAAARKTR